MCVIVDFEKKISVVIPTYNREKTIRRCLDSIICQTCPAFEIIVVDDGSTDRTLEIIERDYSNEVTLVRQEHQGAQAARNAGIRMAKGEYIAFLDSDDEWLPYKLEIQVKELQKNPNAVICGDGYREIEWSEEVPKLYRLSGKINNLSDDEGRKPYKMPGKSGDVYKSMLKESFCMFQALLVSKENLYKIGLLDEKVPSYQEWDTAIRLAKEFRFIYIHKPLFVYHLHDGDTISKNIKRDIDGWEYICEKFKYEILSQLGSKVLTQKYKVLLIKCLQYKDARSIKYFLKYLLGKVNLFIFK